MNDCYPTHSTLTLEEFLDAFGGTLEDWCEQVFLLLENTHCVAGIVDIYESLSVLVIDRCKLDCLFWGRIFN